MTEERDDWEPFCEPVFLTGSSRVGFRNRHLPHWQLDSGFYFVTWRLADSLPQTKLHAWMDEKRAWLKLHPRPWDRETQIEYRDRFPSRIEDWLDSGYGSCLLRETQCATIVSDAIRYFDGERYDVASFVVMPNHVHVLLQLRGTHQIQTVIGRLKSYTALQINRKLSREGPLWQQENWDRILRGAADLSRCFQYIKANPSKAGLSPDEFVYYGRPGFCPET